MIINLENGFILDSEDLPFGYRINESTYTLEYSANGKFEKGKTNWVALEAPIETIHYFYFMSNFIF